MIRSLIHLCLLAGAACSNEELSCSGDSCSAMEALDAQDEQTAEAMTTSLLQQRLKGSGRVANEVPNASDVESELQQHKNTLVAELQTIEAELSQAEQPLDPHDEDVFNGSSEYKDQYSDPDLLAHEIVGAVDPSYKQKYGIDEGSSVKWHMMTRQVVVDEGGEVDTLMGQSAQSCGYRCDQNPRCHSFTMCGSACYLKDKVLVGSEERKANWYCSSFFKAPSVYSPRDPTLARPSTGPEYTFYVYRSMSYGGDYPLGNANTATLGGALWYLHNEIVQYCNGPGTSQKRWGDRKFSIARMKRYKVTYKPTDAIIRKGMHFGPLKSFDFGEATGPHRGSGRYGKYTGALSNGEWDEFGYILGCGILGEWPHADWKSGLQYPNAVWYSLPGACPNKRVDQWDKTCLLDYPGGWCATPTGQGNCTYSYEAAGEIDIDELVGIKPRWSSRAAFCSQCWKEGGPYGSGRGGCGFKYWEGIWSEAKDRWRYEQADAAFKRRYPQLPTDAELQPPACDFNRQRYGI